MFAEMYNLLIWAQVNRGNQPFGRPGGPNVPDAGGALGAMAGMAVFYLLLIAFFVVVLWKIFTKAGEPGWAAIVPIYNVMILSKICGRGEVFGLLVFVPCVGIIVSIMLVFDLAKVFGKGPGFAVGMLFLGIIFYPILAFGSAEYIGADGESSGRRRRRRDEDDDYDDEEEEERPRRVASKDPRIQQRPPAPKRRPADEDEDEEEDRPRPRKR